MWELIAEAGRDPVTGKRRQVSRIFRGNLRDARKARAQLRKGRSPATIAGYTRVYHHNIAATLGQESVAKVTTKMLTDLYGAYQRRGLKARSAYQIHATVSSMMTQACRWGWCDSNPAQWAEPPAKPNDLPVVPTPAEVRRLMTAAEESRRPEYATLIFVAATTGLRRGELCALRRKRDIDWRRGTVTVAHSLVDVNGEPLAEAPTKNRRIRQVALDEHTLALLREHMETMERRAEFAGTELLADAYLFSDTVDGSEPWRPGAVTLYFGRLRSRSGLEHLNFHSLRKFMETYGQDLGFSPVQVAMRAGHDPSVAAKHYTSKLAETDRALATAVAGLLADT